MQITEKQMKEALEGGLTVTVIINGEYYDFAPEGTEKVEEYFNSCKQYWIRQGLPMSQVMSRVIWWDCVEVWNMDKSWNAAKVAFINQYRRYRPYGPTPEKEAVESGNA